MDAAGLRALQAPIKERYKADAKDLTLKQWTVTDPQGFDTTVAVYNLDSTKKPDPNLFVINYLGGNQGGISNQ